MIDLYGHHYVVVGSRYIRVKRDERKRSRNCLKISSDRPEHRYDLSLAEFFEREKEKGLVPQKLEWTFTKSESRNRTTKAATKFLSLKIRVIAVVQLIEKVPLL